MTARILLIPGKRAVTAYCCALPRWRFADRAYNASILIFLRASTAGEKSLNP